MSLGKITLTVTKAILTHDVCTFSTMDPQFLAYYSGTSLTKAYASKIKTNAGKYPMWDETLTMDYNGEKSIYVDVLHEKELIGRADIPTSEILQKGSYSAQYALHKDVQPRGQVYVKISYAGTGGSTNYGMNTGVNNYGLGDVQIKVTTNTNDTGSNLYGYGGINNNLTNTNTNTYGGFGGITGLNTNVINTQQNQTQNQTVPTTSSTTNYNKDLIIPKVNIDTSSNSLYSFNTTGTTHTPNSFYGGMLQNNQNTTTTDTFGGITNTSPYTNVTTGGLYSGITNTNSNNTYNPYPNLNEVKSGVGINTGINTNTTLGTNTGGYYGGISNTNTLNTNSNSNNSTLYTGGGGLDLNSLTNTSNTSNISNNSNTLYSNTSSGSSYTSQFINTNTIYQKSLNYYKNPLFFQHNSRSIWFFDFINNIWKTVNNTNGDFFPMYHRATELPDGSFLITGGEYNGQSLNTTSIFMNRICVVKEKMWMLRKAHTAVYLDGFVYVFGGFGNSGVIKDAEKYDLTKNTWTTIASLTYPRAYGTPVVYGDNYIFLIGGFAGIKIDDYLELGRIERYDTKLNKYDECNVRLPNPVYGCISTLVSDVKLFIAGGWSEEKGKSSEAYTIDLTTGRIEYLTNLTTPGWTVLPPYYINNTFHFFFQGEESNETPTHHTYVLKTPLA